MKKKYPKQYNFLNDLSLINKQTNPTYALHQGLILSGKKHTSPRNTAVNLLCI